MNAVKQSKWDKALSKELLLLQKQESRMAQAAAKARPASWKEQLESKIPDRVYLGLESAFCKGFSLVFMQGKAIIEKGFHKEQVKMDQNIRDYAVQVKGGRKELRQVRKSAQKSDLLNLTITTIEGIGLGALGIGMPDILLFLGTLLKGIYETALNFGFDYESRQEQMLILKMMAAALSTGQDWADRNREIDEMLQRETCDISDEAYQHQLKLTTSVFAVDMLLLKWIQGLPLVGIIGGAANPVYYSKILKYVQLKYRKRYLLQKYETGRKGGSTVTDICIARDFGDGFLFSQATLNIAEKDLEKYKTGNLKEPCESFHSGKYDVSTVMVYTGGYFPKVVRLHKQIPTFDSGDREYDSWHDLYLAQAQDGNIHAVYCTGGYRIAKLQGFAKVLNYPDELKQYFSEV